MKISEHFLILIHSILCEKQFKKNSSLYYLKVLNWYPLEKQKQKPQDYKLIYLKGARI